MDRQPELDAHAHSRVTCDIPHRAGQRFCRHELRGLGLQYTQSKSNTALVTKKMIRPTKDFSYALHQKRLTRFQAPSCTSPPDFPRGSVFMFRIPTFASQPVSIGVLLLKPSAACAQVPAADLASSPAATLQEDQAIRTGSRLQAAGINSTASRQTKWWLVARTERLPLRAMNGSIYTTRAVAGVSAMAPDPAQKPYGHRDQAARQRQQQHAHGHRTGFIRFGATRRLHAVRARRQRGPLRREIRARLVRAGVTRAGGRLSA
jgi:hypothetical protein